VEEDLLNFTSLPVTTLTRNGLSLDSAITKSALCGIRVTAGGAKGVPASDFLGLGADLELRIWDDVSL